MKTLLFMSPLKPGKFSEYKKFTAEISGPRKTEYKDMLKRYQHKSTEIWHQKIGEKEYMIVYHEMNGDPKNPLAGWAASTHPFDVWFKEQLKNLQDPSGIEPAEMILHFKID